MTVHQKDIVEIAFYTGRTPQTHPALIVSTDEIFELEGFFTPYCFQRKTYILNLLLK
jgi:hypothetical protein